MTSTDQFFLKAKTSKQMDKAGFAIHATRTSESYGLSCP